MADPRNPDDTDAISNIDAMIDEDDADLYESDDDGGEDSDTDSDGDIDSDDGGDVSTAGVDGEPSLPMDMPDAKAPAAPQYDPDNPKGFTRVGSLFADADGNIVTRDGRIMAAKGEPARHWSNMSKQVAQGEHHRRQAEALGRQIEQSKKLVAAAKELHELPQRLGISRDDYNLGVQMIAAWNKDPLKVARDIVQRTLARGVNASDIMGKTAGDALEMGAIRQLVNEVTKPQRDREQADRAVRETTQRARGMYDQFLARYPDAAPHGDAIAALMNNNKVSAQEAYHEVRYFAAQNGLDFNRPLGPQIAAKQARAQQPNGNAPQGRTYRAPMVAGNGSGNRNLTNESNFAPADSSWGDILNSVMRQS